MNRPSASLAVSIIGQSLTQAHGLLSKHAIKQVDRLLSNQGIVVWDMFAPWVAEVVGQRKTIVVAMDWTDFDTLLEERIQHTNRVRGLLSGQGVRDYNPLRRDRFERLEALRTGDGRELPPMLKAEIRRELDRIALVTTQLATVERARDALIRTDAEERNNPAALLLKLKGLGPEFASLLWLELLFRSFGNRRQVAAYGGLAPSPWQSGGVERDQGISKSGNRRLRKTMIELAWFWLRHQPDSPLSRWFQARVGAAKGRIRRIAIVALARKLLVALWRYVTQGVVPEGAVFKAA